MANTIVHADLRWPEMTGIGVVKRAILQRVPAAFEVLDLDVSGRIGSPLSPLAVATALARSRARTGLFWSPGFIPPARCALPTVVTVHDLLHLRFYTRFHAAYYNLVLRPLYRRCSAVICVSEFTRREFLEWSGMRAEKVFTVYNGVSDSFRAAPSPDEVMQPPFPYVLYPGNRRAYKNITRLVRAYGNSSLPANGVRLVLTGEPDPELRRAAGSDEAARLIEFAGNVPEVELVGLYRNALLIAFVSLYEGFGLPIVEAMAAGVPVLTSNSSAMAEVAGGAARLVDPYSVEAIVEGLDELASDGQERQARIALGRARAALFDWNTAASQVWNILASV